MTPWELSVNLLRGPKRYATNVALVSHGLVIAALEFQGACRLLDETGYVGRMAQHGVRATVTANGTSHALVEAVQERFIGTIAELQRPEQ